MPPSDDFSLLDGSASYKNLTLKFHKYRPTEGVARGWAEGGGRQEARCPGAPLAATSLKVGAGRARRMPAE